MRRPGERYIIPFQRSLDRAALMSGEALLHKTCNAYLHSTPPNIHLVNTPEQANLKTLRPCLYWHASVPLAAARSSVYVARQSGETSAAHFLVPCCCARHSSVEGIWTCHSVTPVSLSGSTWPLLPSAPLSADPAWPALPDSLIKIFLHQ